MAREAHRTEEGGFQPRVASTVKTVSEEQGCGHYQGESMKRQPSQVEPETALIPEWHAGHSLVDHLLGV